jgi:hypothetical protein
MAAKSPIYVENDLHRVVRQDCFGYLDRNMSADSRASLGGVRSDGKIGRRGEELGIRAHHSFLELSYSASPRHAVTEAHRICIIENTCHSTCSSSAL